LKREMTANAKHGNRHIILAVAYAVLNSSKAMFVYMSIVTEPGASSVRLPVDADRLATQVKDTIQAEGEESLSNAKLWEYFPPIQLGHIKDHHGSILFCQVS
jgi:hypothetical protein